MKTSTIYRKILGWKVGDKCAINYPTFGVKAYGIIVELIQEEASYFFILNKVKYYHVAVIKLTSYPWKPIPERIIIPVKWLEDV